MKKENNEDKPLGFLFGYKETVQIEPNKFSVKFMHGTSEKFPSKYKNKKDFYADPIYEGQVSELFINTDEFKRVYDNQLEEVNTHKSHYIERFHKKKYLMPKMSEEQYLEFQAFSYSFLDFIYKHVDDEVEKTLLKKCLSSFNLTDDELLNTYKEYKQACSIIYEKDLKRALGDDGNHEDQKETIKVKKNKPK